MINLRTVIQAAEITEDPANVARMKCNGIRGRGAANFPDSAALHPGYGGAFSSSGGIAMKFGVARL
jgi:hypothetical protein